MAGPLGTFLHQEHSMRYARRWHLLLLGATLVAWAATPIAAQTHATDRGVWLAGGTARISGHRDIGNDTKTFVIDLNPRVGYFVLPHLVLSANLQYVRSSDDLGSSRTVGVGPGLSYYFGGPTSRVLPYLTSRTLFQWGRSGLDDQPSSFRDSDLSWLAGAGASILVARNVGVTAEAFYQWTRFAVETADWEGSNSSEQYGVQFGVTVFAY
jgi:opacity protein-like surface antigen